MNICYWTSENFEKDKVHFYFAQRWYIYSSTNVNSIPLRNNVIVSKWRLENVIKCTKNILKIEKLFATVVRHPCFRKNCKNNEKSENIVTEQCNCKNTYRVTNPPSSDKLLKTPFGNFSSGSNVWENVGYPVRESENLSEGGFVTRLQ